MNTNPGDPNEVESILKQKGTRDMTVQAPVSENMHPHRAAQDGCQGASISAYRSAYLKLHFDDL